MDYFYRVPKFKSCQPQSDLQPPVTPASVDLAHSYILWGHLYSCMHRYTDVHINKKINPSKSKNLKEVMASKNFKNFKTKTKMVNILYQNFS